MKLQYLFTALLFTLFLSSCGDVEELNREDLLPDFNFSEETTGSEDPEPPVNTLITAMVDGVPTTFIPSSKEAQILNSSSVGNRISLTASTGMSQSDSVLSFTFNEDDLEIGNNLIDASSTNIVASYSLLNISDNVSELTDSGNVNITSIDTSAGIVSGTFSLTVNQFDDANLSSPINTVQITNGIFRFGYDVNP